MHVCGSRDRLAHRRAATRKGRANADYPWLVMFSHDTEHSLQTIVDLVNTDPSFGDDEGLPDVEALGRFFGLADRLEAAELANGLISRATVRPRLTDHDDYDWHLHYFSPEATLAEHLAVDGGMALAHVVTIDEIDRLRICEAPTCHAVLLDLSRNSSKRYCDASTCGNRLHVAAYRRRKRSENIANRA